MMYLNTGYQAKAYLENRGGGGHFIVDNEDFNIKWDIKYEYL